MYTIAYNIETNNSFNTRWTTLSDLEKVETVDEFTCRDFFKSHYIPFEEIEWDIDQADESSDVSASTVVHDIPDDVLALLNSSPAVNLSHKSPNKPKIVMNATSNDGETIINPTPKEDLYLAPPRYPRFDTSVVRFAQHAPYDRMSIIYESLPQIPTKQNEISITTNVNELTDSNLLNLYPNRIIQTRKPMMYEEISGVKFYPDIGTVLPIKGFTEKQILDNVIKYPHLYHLKRTVDGESVPFHKYIEIDGELFDTDSVWDSLPIAKIVPKKSEYVMEYVTRRYLLERDVKKIEHKFKMDGALHPFLTLFAPSDFYIAHGYKDIVDIAKQCVEARIVYRSSRNGVLLNSGVDRCIFAPFCFKENCKVICPTFQQIDYLLDKNDLLPPSPVFAMEPRHFEYVSSVLKAASGTFRVVEKERANDFARLFTYCGICDTWNGSKFSMSTYNLKFSRFVDLIRQSWSMREEPDELQYMKIWSRSAKVLIISNLDYVSFGDVECQQLLQLLQDREEPNKSTVVVIRQLRSLVGRSSFLNTLISVLSSKKYEGGRSVIK